MKTIMTDSSEYKLTRNNQKKTIAIIVWNTNGNALGRAYMLAEALSEKFAVKVVGFTFNTDNNSLWEPLKDGAIPVLSYPGQDFPEFIRSLESIVPTIKADIILASKLRLPSLQLGLLMKAFQNRPLILDIDDYEIGIFNEKIMKLDENIVKKPHGDIWTRYCENLIGYADEVIVSNTALQEKYGGTVIPHARDENIFDRSLYSKEERRKELGISLKDKIVLFLGTPRKHKGLLELFKAIKRCGDPSYKLCIMGSFPETFHERKLKESLEAMGGDQLFLFPDQPFKDAAKNVIIADLVCLLQDQENEVSRFQFPAKAVDAIAMGVPVLALQTPPIKPLIDQGVIFPTTLNSLAEDIQRILSDADLYTRKQIDKRSVFLDQFSYRAISKNMEAVIANSIKKPKALPKEALSFINLQKNLNHEDVNKLLEAEKERVKYYYKAEKEKIKRLTENLKKLKLEHKQLEHKHEKFLNSRFWRLTFPLRIITGYVKRILTISKRAQK